MPEETGKSKVASWLNQGLKTVSSELKSEYSWLFAVINNFCLSLLDRRTLETTGVFFAICSASSLQRPNSPATHPRPPVS